MPDDADPVDAQQRSPAVGLLAGLPFQRAESAAQQQRPQQADGVARQLALQPLADGMRHAFAGLEDHVAGEAVANHHVHLALEQVMPLHVADEAHRGLFEQLERLLAQQVALGLFGPDAHQAHLGLGPADHLAGIGRAHDGKLHQDLRRAVGRGPAIDQHDRLFGGRGHRHGDAGTADAFERTQFQGGGGHGRARAAGSKHGVRHAFLDQVHRPVDGGILLAANGRGRRFAHADHFRGVLDFNPPRIPAAPGHFGPDGRFIPHQIQLLDIPAFLEGQQRSFDDSLGGKIAPHGVNRYSHNPCAWFRWSK